MKFIVDVQLPGALVRELRRRGHEAHRVVDIILPTTPDALVLTLAVARGAIIMTKDEDYVDLSARAVPPVALVWFRCGNISNAELLRLVDRNFERLVSALDRGELLIEIR